MYWLWTRQATYPSNGTVGSLLSTKTIRRVGCNPQEQQEPCPTIGLGHNQGTLAGARPQSTAHVHCTDRHIKDRGQAAILNRWPNRSVAIRPKQPSQDSTLPSTRTSTLRPDTRAIELPLNTAKEIRRLDHKNKQ